MPELDLWFMWRRGKTAVLPSDWQRQPLRQMVINNTLDFVEHTFRLYGKKDYNWSGEFNGTQFGLIGWINGNE